MHTYPRKTGGVFTMLVLLLFSVCSLLLILIGYHVYRKIDDNMDENSRIRSSFYYLSNRIRSDLTEDSAELLEANGIQMLSLDQSSGDMELYSYVYFYDGAVREQLVTDPSEFDPAYGEVILDAGGFTMVLLGNGLLELTVETRENEAVIMKISLRP